MTPDEKQRTDGKSLYKIVVTYEYKKEIRTQNFVNQTADNVKSIREAIFCAGLGVLMNPGHWVVVAPSSVIEIEIFLQKNYHE